MNTISNSIKTNEYEVAYSNKISLSNNYDIEIVESQNITPDTKQVINNTKIPGFTIKKVQGKPLKTIVIFMSQNNKFVGFISANIYKDNTASLMMSGINYTPLPEHLNNFRNYLLYEKKQDVALYIDEQYRKQGLASKLIYLMLSYLFNLGITDVKVSGITNETALKTYTSTGAVEIGPKTAIYTELDKILSETDKQKTL